MMLGVEDTVKGQCGWRNAVNAVNVVRAASEPLRAGPRVWRLNNKRGQCIDKVLRMRAPGLVTDGGVQGGVVAWPHR
ncbi:hypothetical protein E2C01_042778 [Portunus trituberculatus]|uniref:Uncharacterized protein n=1 Tax=Portunus trituberculatus TaxID=210409 RepID=A0A5B7FNG6_PORTR|nr:hypothetical protein [Portunus trituberculatus]